LTASKRLGDIWHLVVVAVVKAGLSNVGEALFKLARCHQDQRAAVVALHHILLHLQLLFAEAGQLPLLLLLLTDGAHASRLARNLGLALVEGNAFPGHHVHILEMAAQVTGLREGLLALGAGEGALARVLAEVVPQVAALFKDAVAAAVSALEVKLHAQGLWVPHLDGLVPVAGNSLKRFRFNPLVELARCALGRNFPALSNFSHQVLGPRARLPA